MVMLWISMLGSAHAEFPGWTQYAQCAAATAVAMPVTYAMGEALTGTSNQLVPGMPADVLVKTGSRTLLRYLTSPLQRMFEKSLIEE